jgi:predicted aldo/keto reductase-like oxidoreductase
VSSEHSTRISRRSFVQQSGLVAGGVLLGTGAGAVLLPAAEPNNATGAGTAPAPWPTRVLGKTNVPITTMTLGTAPCGLCPKIPTKDIAAIVNLAIDLGITAIDTAPSYVKSEESIGMALGPRRKEVFLSTKALANTVEEAEKSFTKSLRLLKTDCVDLLYYHSIGTQKLEGTFGPNGVFTWLVKQKKAGKCRFIGVSGHCRPGRFPKFLETGEVDAAMVTLNFVDRHIYNFEREILDVARKNNVGVVAMKVFGGARRAGGSYSNPDSPPELDVHHLDLAVRYALGLPGVTTLNLGVHKEDQVRKNVEMVKNCKPLTQEEQDKVAALGKQLFRQWGPRFGPVAEEEVKA